MSEYAPIFLFDAPIGGADYAVMPIEESWRPDSNCPHCSRGLPMTRLFPGKFGYDGGGIGNFISGVGQMLVRAASAREIAKRFDCCRFEPIEVTDKPLPLGDELVELVVEKSVPTHLVSGVGFSAVIQCSACGSVSIEIENRERANHEMFTAVLEGAPNYVDKKGYDDVELSASLLDGCDIFLVEHVHFCTEPFVDFCIERGYTNVGFVRIGYLTP